VCVHLMMHCHKPVDVPFYVFIWQNEEITRPVRSDIFIAVTMKANWFWLANCSILKMEKVYFFKTCVSFYQTTQHLKLDDSNFKDSLVFWPFYFT
jgi:hypothetical protein